MMKYLGYTVVLVASLSLIALVLLVASDLFIGSYEEDAFGKEQCQSRWGGVWVDGRCICTEDSVPDPDYQKEQIERCAKLKSGRKA